MDDLAATRHLLLGPLSTLLRARIAAALVGGVAMPLLVLCILSSAGSAGSTDSTGSVGWMAPAALAAAFAVFVIGELIDRRLFFLGSVAPRRYGDSR